MSSSAGKLLACTFGSLVMGASGFALAQDTREVDCSRGDLIGEALTKKNPDRPLTVVVRGTCGENVLINRDDITLDGGSCAAGSTARVEGTITVLGARRVLIKGLTVSAPGIGILGTENAAFTVDDSCIEGNGSDGVHVQNSAHGTITRSRIADNGRAGLVDSGRGIHAVHGGTVHARDNTIVNNRSDGVGVNNDAYARLIRNTIEGNGRFAAGEAGVQVTRARVRAHGNIIRNNTGLTAVIVSNHADYRTGSFLSTADFPDNEFAFEVIEHAVDSGRLAVDVSNNSFGDFRQVHIVGSISVGAQSMLQVRGDDVGPDRTCSTIGIPAGGFFTISGRNGLARLRFVNVTPPVVTTFGPNGQLDGPTTCVVLP